MSIVYLGLGTNLGDRVANLRTAVSLLAVCGSNMKLSSVYVSEPWGYESDNEFYNCVLRLETGFSVTEMLSVIGLIEKKIGRTPKSSIDYSDRVIDVDILLFDDQIITTNELSVPHPRMHHRKFVLNPLLEIDDPVHPVFRKKISELNKGVVDKEPAKLDICLTGT